MELGKPVAHTKHATGHNAPLYSRAILYRAASTQLFLPLSQPQHAPAPLEEKLRGAVHSGARWPVGGVDQAK